MNENIMSKDFVKAKYGQTKFIKKGSILHGVVKNIEQYGAFIELPNNMVGILHTEDISVSRINNPGDRYKIGDNVKVKVKAYDANTGRLQLTTKELFGSWDENIKSFKEKTVVKGIARDNDKFGIFVELKPNLVGLAKYKNGVFYGDEVNVYIKKISTENQRVKLVIVD